MSFNRIVPIVLVMLVSFVLTLGYGYWRQRPDPPPAPAQVGRALDGEVPKIARAAPAVGNSADSGSAQPAKAATAAQNDPQPKPKPREIVVPPRNEDGPPMPVVFSFSNRVVTEAADDAGAAPSGSRRILEGVVYNSSDQNLQLTVTEQNPETLDISQTQLVVLHGVQQRFGADDGLKMASGAEITLHSDPYRDLSQRVP